ncbi:rhodanese-like domain-containing protein [Wenzhouxiangella sp. AB-CW3]|uniref:rhodanese-like domain-containing protein n=1 Tax=Wenzhouxiangella sp. AB-CW3 TaxID=2771012 RepID=UPI00168ADA84|nr:rhodanese-like domain-containing protein [Wenzhouxiangella sp. AB-CW3]QOC24029.1 rhodanese-like domain-containing protein [Wenzhouxiangella sp. AB-CW3]
MERIFEFIGNHPVLTGIFGVVLLAWIIYEVSRLTRPWKEVDTLGAVRMINREEPIILDVSNSTDFAKGHIHGALHMPPSKIEAGNQQLLKHKDRPVIVYCKNGQVSPQMATRLSRLGFASVSLLSGGLTQWQADQQPVTRHKGAAKPDRKERKKKKDAKGKQGDEAN